MRFFAALRAGDRVVLLVREGPEGTTREIGPEDSLRVRRHSPDGFEMGYGGSGPAQLALAILLECLPRGDAERLYQQFKERYLVGAPDGLEITEEEVCRWALEMT